MLAKDFISIVNDNRDKSDESCINSIYQSPISIEKNPEKCSLKCAIDFVYPEQRIRHLQVKLRMLSKSIPMIYFDVVTESTNNKILPDIIFNNEKFLLRRIEIYMNSLHRINYDDKLSEIKPMEIVYIHESFYSDLKYLCVSVFSYPMISYSIYQDEFKIYAEILQNLSSKILNDINTQSYFDQYDNSTIKDSSFFLQKMDKEQAFLSFFKNDLLSQGFLYFKELEYQSEENNFFNEETSSQFESKYSLLKLSKEKRYNNVKIQKIPDNVTLFVPKVYRKQLLESTWNISLPTRKSFFFYQGSFPYSSCHPESSSKPESDVTWIIMENSMPIHTDDYSFLKAFFGDFPGNSGSKYPVYPLNSQYIDPAIVERKLYYNDGTFVFSRNRKNDHVEDRYISKCIKREQIPIFNDLYISKENEKNEIAKENNYTIVDQTNLRKQKILYNSDQNSLLIILLWIFFTILLIGTLYYCTTKDSMYMFSFSILCLLVYYLSNWTKVIRLLSLFINILALFSWYSILNFVMKKEETALSYYLYFLIFIKYCMILFILLTILSITFTSSSLLDTYQHTLLFVRLPKKKGDHYLISKDSLFLTISIGSNIIDYNINTKLRLGYKFSFDNFKLLPKDDPMYKENPTKLYRDILIEYDHQMKNSILNPWESFKRAVIKYVLFNQVYYYPNGPIEGIKLNFNTIDTIVRKEFPDLSEYLIIS